MKITLTQHGNKAPRTELEVDFLHIFGTDIYLPSGECFAHWSEKDECWIHNVSEFYEVVISK